MIELVDECDHPSLTVNRIIYRALDDKGEASYSTIISGGYCDKISNLFRSTQLSKHLVLYHAKEQMHEDPLEKHPLMGLTRRLEV